MMCKKIMNRKKIIYITAVIIGAMLLIFVCRFCHTAVLTSEYEAYSEQILIKSGIEFDSGTVRVIRVRKLILIEFIFECDGKKKKAYAEYPFTPGESEIVVN